MRKFNIFLMILLILMIAFCVYFFVGGQLRADVRTVTANASDYPEAFASIRNVLASNSAPQQFTGDIPQDAAGYTLVDMTIRLSNYGLFDAEWIDISLTPAAGDIAVYSVTGEGSSVPGRTTGQVNLKLISTASQDTVRTVALQYYVYGMSHTITVTG